MKKAIIDLGTNTFNLLIATVTSSDFSIIEADRIAVAIGQGGINKGIITEEAIERALTALVQFKTVCDKLHVDSVRAIGTSAIRDAKNKREFCERVFERTNINIEVIDGEKEADLIYKGVKWSYDFMEPAVIMDIGGGSTEFIFANKSGVLDQISLNIGVARIADLQEFSDPLTPEEVDVIENWLEQQAGAYFENKTCAKLIGASGSFETFYELLHQLDFPAEIVTFDLPINDLKQLLSNLIFSTENDRKNNRWIATIRKKMVPIAAVKVNWIIKKLNIKEVSVSSCSLKEGALMDETSA
jgi:exopolyphosphatase/guanosine-5'-triphosphate,3'-diphosphate pyrophosphatase